MSNRIVSIGGTFATTGNVSSEFTPKELRTAAADRPVKASQEGFFNISLSGTWAGTIALERKYSSTDAFKEVTTWTANVEGQREEREAGVAYRLKMKAYTSGTPTYRLSKSIP